MFCLSWWRRCLLVCIIVIVWQKNFVDGWLIGLLWWMRIRDGFECAPQCASRNYSYSNSTSHFQSTGEWHPLSRKRRNSPRLDFDCILSWNHAGSSEFLPELFEWLSNVNFRMYVKNSVQRNEISGTWGRGAEQKKVFGGILKNSGRMPRMFKNPFFSSLEKRTLRS